MGAVTKPEITTNIFADSAPIDGLAIVEPTYMPSGFPLTAGPGSPPVRGPRGFFNWLFNHCMKGVRYLVQRGITDWDTLEDGYAAGATVQATDGNIYRLIGTATPALTPQSDQGNWQPTERPDAVNDLAGGGATSFDGSSNPSTWDDMLAANGSPISGLDMLPTFAAGSGFHVAVGAGFGHLNTSVGIGVGESTYRTIYWSGQTVSHANPDVTSSRFDAITVTPAAFGTESVLAVVTGTPAAIPVVPAIPAGSAVLFYVSVPANAADATHFRACRGLARRVGYPWSGMSAIVSGCELSWDYTANPSSISAELFIGATNKTGTAFTVNRLLIDGEPIEWAGWLNSNAGVGVVQDSTANPFGSAASASFDRPYYIYAVGGRHNPMPSENGTGILNPITVCESTVAPNPQTGKPTGNLTVNGVTVTPNGALYIGLGFVAANTTFRRGCLMDGDMTYSLQPMQQFSHVFAGSGREDAGTFTAGCQPAISTKMAVSLAGEPAGSIDTTYALFVADFPVAITPFFPVAQGAQFTAYGSLTMIYATVSFSARTGAELWVQSIPGSGTAYGNLVIGARGFDHRVRRLVSGY